MLTTYKGALWDIIVGSGQLNNVFLITISCTDTV